MADDNEPLGGVIVFDYDKCDGCGLCAQECCGGAIEMRQFATAGADPVAHA